MNVMIKHIVVLDQALAVLKDLITVVTGIVIVERQARVVYKIARQRVGMGLLKQERHASQELIVAGMMSIIVMVRV